MWRLQRFPRPSDCLCVTRYQRLKSVLDFHEIRYMKIFKKICLSSSNWYSESHVSLEDVNEMLPVLRTFSLVMT